MKGVGGYIVYSHTSAVTIACNRNSVCALLYVPAGALKPFVGKGTKVWRASLGDEACTSYRMDGFIQ